MLAVIWMALLFSVMGFSDTAGTTEKSSETYNGGWSINFSEELITSEAGLCIVIPCSFTHGRTFKPKSATWFKCESKPKCEDADRIFHSEEKAKDPSGGRVALLEPDITRRNCGITINDLTESDTGSYQFRVEIPTAKNPSDGYTFGLQKTLRVTGLKQKPQVDVPPALTEGQQTTLTCTAPGLCSGTPPNITWTWRKTGHNVTIFQTENLTSVGQRHSSSLTFNPSPEHDDSEVTCQVTFKGNITTVETVTLNVTYLKEPRIRGDTTVEEGGTLNLTCDVESSPPSTVIWTGRDCNKKLLNGTERANLVIHMVTGEHSGRYSCTAQHLTKTLTVFADVTVMTFPEILNGSECVPKPEGQNEGFFSIITEVKTIIAFLIGVSLSTTICCLATACQRCKEKNSRDQAEMLQMVTCQDQQTGGGQGADGDEQSPQREADRDQNSGAPGSSVPQGEVKEVDYASIDYSHLKKRNAEEAEHKQETTETEYAEVKREAQNKKQDSGAEDSGTLKREDDEEEAMIGQHEKTGHCKTEEEEGEDTALYSNVKAIMGEG